MAAHFWRRQKTPRGKSVERQDAQGSSKLTCLAWAQLAGACHLLSPAWAWLGPLTVLSRLAGKSPS